MNFAPEDMIEDIEDGEELEKQLMMDLKEQSKNLGSDDDGEGPELELEIRPLYSKMDAAQQKKVFDKPKPGKRVCVIATNVAETSLTIPDVKYIVDSGKIKRKVNLISLWIEYWI